MTICHEIRLDWQYPHASMTSIPSCEFVITSIITFINNLEVIDNVNLNELANQNLAPSQLIKKRAEYKGTTINISKLDMNHHSLKNSASRHLKKLKLNQFCSNHSANHSAILDSLHLAHPGSAARLDLCQNVWFPHIHRSIVQMAKNCKDCTEQV